MGFTLDAAFVEAAMLASLRIVAFLILAPPFSFSGVPLRIKGMLAIALSLLVAPHAAQSVPPDLVCSLNAMVEPQRSPIRVLEALCGQSLAN